MNTGIPTGDSPVATVPMFNAWIMWWNADRLQHGLHGYWDAPIFSPTRGTFAFSEPQPFTMLFAPFVIFSGPVLAYNVYALFTLTMNGLIAYLFLRSIRIAFTSSIIGGMAMSLLPLAVHNLEALQLAAVWPIVLTLWSFREFVVRNTLVSAVRCAAASSLCVWTCIHHALFLAMLLVTCGWIGFICLSKNKRIDASRILAKAALFTATVVALTGPVLLPMARIHANLDLKRSPEIVRVLSASPNDWLHTPHSFGEATPTTSFPLFPGTFICVLAVLGCSTRRQPARSLVPALLCVGICSFFLSFGRNLEYADWNFWELLAKLLPFIESVRSPYRFAYFTQIAIVLLASFGIDTCIRRLTAYTVFQPKLARLVAVGAVGSVLTFQLIPPHSFMSYPPILSHRPGWVEHLEKNAPLNASILCLPVATDTSELANQQETLWMMYGTMHARPLANGYSGFTPDTWSELQSKVNREEPDIDTVAQLRQLGVRWVVIRLDRVSAVTVSNWEELAIRVYQSPHFSLFRLE